MEFVTFSIFIWPQGKLELLIKKFDVNLNEKTKFGRTGLHLASSEGHQQIVELLINLTNVNLTKALK